VAQGGPLPRPRGTPPTSHPPHPPHVLRGTPRPPHPRAPAASATDAKPVAPAADEVELGKSGLRVSAVGIGAWSWGDRSGYWGQDAAAGYGKGDALDCYNACLELGLNFVDTAEVYGFGLSEEYLGEFMASSPQRPVVATKFPPTPFYLTEESLVKACRGSLGRLGMDSMGLYMQHWPGFLVNGFSNDAYVRGLIRVRKEGLAQAVGVSNFNERRLREAHARMAGEGVALASNQVQYSLIYRAPETNGVLDACRELGVTLVAYSPLAQGLLTGKYTGEGAPAPRGPRQATFVGKGAQAAPLVELLREIGDGRGGKTPAQVALNWCLCKGVLPIPGAKNRRQVVEAAGALGWRLDDGEVRALDDASRGLERLHPGAPFENW